MYLVYMYSFNWFNCDGHMYLWLGTIFKMFTMNGLKYVESTQHSRMPLILDQHFYALPTAQQKISLTLSRANHTGIGSKRWNFQASGW